VKGERMMKKLISQSQEAFLLSLELFNRFNNNYRIEGFSFFIINAWELLLKAKLIQVNEDDKAIYYKKDPKENSLSIADCLNKIFTDKGNKVRENIFEVKSLRDLATHLVIPEMENIYIGVLQATVINYTRYLYKWFEVDLEDRFSPGMLAITYGNEPIDILKLKRRYPKEIISIIEKTQSEIKEKTKEDTDHLYSIPIDYKLAFTKNPKKADIVVSMDKDSKLNLIEVEKPLNINESHPNKVKDITKTVNDKLGTTLSRHDISMIIEFEGFKQTEFSEYHSYIKTTNYHVYSDKLVDFIIDKMENNPNYIERCKNRVRDRHKKRVAQGITS